MLRTSIRGSVAAAQLKVVSVPVFSMGRVGEEENPADLHQEVHVRVNESVYRKLVLRRGRLVGAMAVGKWSEGGRVQEAITRKQRVWFWQLARFRRHGRLWPAAEARSVAL